MYTSKFGVCLKSVLLIMCRVPLDDWARTVVFGGRYQVLRGTGTA